MSFINWYNKNNKDDIVYTLIKENVNYIFLINIIPITNKRNRKCIDLK